MKVLWITNCPIGALHQQLYGRDVYGRGWMDAMLAEIVKKPEILLTVATIGNVRNTLHIKEGGVEYYQLPSNSIMYYNYTSEHHLNDWRKIISKVNPDLIMIWGTEYSHGLAALSMAEGIPSVIFVQGLIELVARYYDSGISMCDQLSNLTLRDISHLSGIPGEKYRCLIRSKAERALINKCGNFICENDWSRAHCEAINPMSKFYDLPLSINQSFNDYRWALKDIELHTIMTGACSYPLKGLHILMKAIALVKRRFPEVRLLVPGDAMQRPSNILQSISQTGYNRYLNNLIIKLGIEENIQFVGNLTAEQMAERMAKVHVFVTPSALENHSSTLKEAMTVGTPCIASYVGGIPEYVTHYENGLLYRFEEYEMLAFFIQKLFCDDNLAQRISKNGRSSIKNIHDSSMISQGLVDIYMRIIESHHDTENIIEVAQCSSV